MSTWRYFFFVKKTFIIFFYNKQTLSVSAIPLEPNTHTETNKGNKKCTGTLVRGTIILDSMRAEQRFEELDDIHRWVQGKKRGEKSSVKIPEIWGPADNKLWTVDYGLGTTKCWTPLTWYLVLSYSRILNTYILLMSLLVHVFFFVLQLLNTDIMRILTQWCPIGVGLKIYIKHILLLEPLVSNPYPFIFTPQQTRDLYVRLHKGNTHMLLISHICLAPCY